MDERTLKEIIREELGKLSKLTWGQRLTYIWDYYKPLFAAIIGIIAVISIGVTIYQNKQLNHLLNIYFINCNSIEVNSEDVTNGFAEALGGIGEKDVIQLDTTMAFTGSDSQYEMANQMKMMALSSAAEMDLVVVDEEKYLELEEQSFFADLSQILTEEQLTGWADLLVEGTALEDGTVPITGIDLTDSPVLQEINAYPGLKVYGAVVVSSVRTELCDDFFTYLLAE